VPFPCLKGGCTHAWVQKCDSIFEFHHFSVSRHVLGYTLPITAKKWGEKTRPQRTWCVGLFAGQKWCISGNPGNHAFWPPPGCRESFSMLPGHALSSSMVWNVGDGPWWAATADIFNKHQALVSPSEHKLIWQTMPDELFNKTQPIRLTREGSAVGRQIFEWLNIVFMLTCAQQNNRNPKRFSGWCLIVNCTFPCQGGPKPDLHPRPPDLHQNNVPNTIANTPGKLMAPGRSY